MSLKNDCKFLGISIQDFEFLTDTRQRTLNRWIKTRPTRYKALFNSIYYKQQLHQFTDNSQQDNLF